jgi:hypothetical protein
MFNGEIYRLLKPLMHWLALLRRLIYINKVLLARSLAHISCIAAPTVMSNQARWWASATLRIRCIG